MWSLSWLYEAGVWLGVAGLIANAMMPMPRRPDMHLARIDGTHVASGGFIDQRRALSRRDELRRQRGSCNRGGDAERFQRGQYAEHVTEQKVSLPFYSKLRCCVSEISLVKVD